VKRADAAWRLSSAHHVTLALVLRHEWSASRIGFPSETKAAINSLYHIPAAAGEQSRGFAKTCFIAKGISIC
jgi:hypothetical protein